jgi:hypothetical protein
MQLLSLAQEQYMVDKLAGIGVNITWPPVDGALPAARDAAPSPEALQQPSRPADQVTLSTCSACHCILQLPNALLLGHLQS